MALVAMQRPKLQQSHTVPPPSHAQSPLTLDTSKYKGPLIPNKHLPYCPTGPSPSSQHRASPPATPPSSPPSKHSTCQMFSLLNPAHTHLQISNNPPVYSITASTLATAIDSLATQQFPDPKQVFPWLHGLHPDNQVQLAFFFARRKSLRNAPRCFRGIAIVKVGDFTKSRLKGALDLEELLSPQVGEGSAFLDIDPRDGFSVRNFHIQAVKMARLSDIVVYGDDETTQEDTLSVAKRIAIAQRDWLEKCPSMERDAPTFNTFVISSPFSEFEKCYPSLVAIDSKEQSTGKVIDFCSKFLMDQIIVRWERQEMCNMSKASEIAHNVWLGPSPDPTLQSPSDGEEKPKFDIYIEANDMAQAPDVRMLNHLGELSFCRPQHLEFPSSGSIMPPTRSTPMDPLTEMCQWMFRLANPQITPDSSEDEQDADGDIHMKRFFPSPRKILIHCADGYTENSLLGLAYFMYSEGVPTHDAWLRLHCEKKRNFFAYSSDVALLGHLQSRLLESSPRSMTGNLSGAPVKEPAWLSQIDGSLPSRILPYMYLGNLGHANNPDLLRAMGITRILSVGESVNWSKTQLEAWGTMNVLLIDRVQDNGVDPLMNEFERCLDFIAVGNRTGTATLVHCRVGVSRSATICIAEVMASMDMSFPRAYCFVRARRLNVIIQPHLRFAYELLKWDEILQQRRGEPVRRELEWATIAREIAAMNKPYSR